VTVNIENVGSGGSGWSRYVLGKNNDRDHAKLVIGDTALGDAITNSIDYKSGNYVRFVISFAKEDNVTPERGRKIVKEFFDEFMHGFSSDEYHLDVVEHTDTDYLHYHGRIPKLNLLTGTQLKLYWHKSDLKYKKAVIDYIAEKHGLIVGIDKKKLIPDPQQRVKQINEWRREHGQKPFDLSKKKGRGEAEERISDYINDAIMSGLLDSLDDVVSELNAMGFEIAKIGHDKGKDFDYITIQNDTGKLRLRGDIYGERFYRHNRADRAKAISSNRSIEAGRGSDQKSRSDIDRALQRERRKRLDFIDRQYGRSRERAIQRVQERAKNDERHDNKDKKKSDLSSPYRPYSWHNNRHLRHPLPLTAKGADRQRERNSEIVRRNEISTSKQDTKSKDRGLKNDSTGTEAIRRIRAIRAEQSRRARATASRIKYNSATEQTDYQAIARTAQRRGHSREVEAHLIGIFHYFGEKLNSFKQRIDRANQPLIKELRERITDAIKDRAMQELNRFKRDINLAEFSTAFGYYKDKDKSSLNAPVMRHENGDKIVIGRDKADGHYIYFNPHNNSDSGTIIDFVKNRTGETLGRIRKRLRQWLHNPQPQENITVKASTKDAMKIANTWERIKEANHCLTQYWGIGSKGNSKLAQMPKVKYGEDGYFYFMLSNLQGICGIEKRNDAEKHIIAGSEKGVFVTGKLQDAPNIYIFESPIDMISHRQMGKHNVADFTICTMGSIGESGANSIKAIFERNRDAQIIIAVDNDAGGDLATKKISEILEQVDGNTKRAKREKPQLKDWNDDLRAKQQKQQRQTQSRGLYR
jgi:hypothetical protein